MLEYNITKALDATDTYYIRPKVVGKAFYDRYIKAYSCCIAILANSLEEAVSIFLTRGYLIKDDLAYKQ